MLPRTYASSVASAQAVDQRCHHGSGSGETTRAEQPLELLGEGLCWLNSAFHRIAVTQIRDYPPAKAYLSRKLAEGKSKREALRCLKRHLVRTVYMTMTARLRDAPAAELALT